MTERMLNICCKCNVSFPWKQGEKPHCPKCGEPTTGGYFGTPINEFVVPENDHKQPKQPRQ